jgi:hypothetical protein
MYFLPGAYMVIQPVFFESPTTTAIAPLFCIYLTLVINEHPPLSTNAIQSVQGGETILQPVGSCTGSIINPILPFGDILGPKDAILS